MSTANWARGVSGSFNNPADWSESPPPSNIVPDGSYDAELSATGTYTVTSSESNTVYGLGLSVDAKLAITDGTFIDVNGTDGADDAGTIAIDNNTVFLVGLADTNSGAIPLDVSGAITLDSTGSPTVLFLDGGGSGTYTIDLYGGGKLTLSNNANNFIYGSLPPVFLDNSDTISGAGTIYIDHLDNESGGSIDADGSNPLIFLDGDVTNLGTIKATSTGGLVFNRSSFNNTGGTVEAATAGSVIDLVASGISGGALSTIAGSSIVITGSYLGPSTIDPNNLTNAGDIEVDDSAILILGSSNFINNSGKIALNAALDQTFLELDGTVTLAGKGKITLTDNPGNLIESNGSSCELVNTDNTISGAGTIGDGNTTLYNEGVIDGSGKNPLILTLAAAADPGTIESSSTGGVEFLNDVIDNVDGVVEATASGSQINLDNSTIEYGLVKTVAGSILDAIPGTSDVITGLTLDNAGTLLANNSTLSLDGDVDNTGSIVVETGTIEINDDLSLTGTGKVMLGGLNPQMISNGSAATLTNGGNTFSGGGTIGDGNTTLDNEAGVIDANNPTVWLIINTGANTIANNGTMEATAGASLYLQSPITNDGKLIADSGTLNVVQALTGTGALTIESDGNMNLGAAGDTQNTTFASGATGTLTLDAAATTTPTAVYDGTIFGFGTSDEIALAGLTYEPGTTTVGAPVFSAGDTTVTVSNGTDTVALTFAGNLTGHTFEVGDNGFGGTLLTDPVSKPATGGIPVNVPLLGSYMASLFATVEGQVGAQTTTAETVQSEAVLAHPHAG